MGTSPLVGHNRSIGKVSGTDLHAAGNAEGSIILFQPQNSEHISARTIIDPITAMAPAWDCKTYAVG